jgi:hypothetical protein
MSEVVTAVEVNFSTSGGSHTATVSTSNAQTTCGTQALGSVSGKLGERSTFTKREIDDLLTDFVLEEESSTKDAYGIKKQYKFLEKENWFKHDFRSREDKKLIRLKMKWKSSAPIGVFWQLCEMIYENAGLLDYDIDVIAYSCGDSVELVEDVI